MGVVADVTYPSFFNEKPAAVYIPFRQHLWQYAREDEWIHTRKVLAVRTSVDPLTLVRGIAGAVAQVDRDQAAHEFMTMEQRVSSVALGHEQPLLRLALHHLRLARDPAGDGRASTA